MTAYILWESLLALLVLSALVSLFLGHLTRHRKELQAIQKQAQTITVATMAIQTQTPYLSINDQKIKVMHNNQRTSILSNGEELFHVTVLSP